MDSYVRSADRSLVARLHGLHGFAGKRVVVLKE